MAPFSFPSHNLISVKCKFYLNPEYEFEFYPILRRVYFILSQNCKYQRTSDHAHWHILNFDLGEVSSSEPIDRSMEIGFYHINDKKVSAFIHCFISISGDIFGD